jgi:hypothetical protein
VSALELTTDTTPLVGAGRVESQEAFDPGPVGRDKEKGADFAKNFFAPRLALPSGSRATGEQSAERSTRATASVASKNAAKLGTGGVGYGQTERSSSAGFGMQVEAAA